MRPSHLRGAARRRLAGAGALVALLVLGSVACASDPASTGAGSPTPTSSGAASTTRGTGNAPGGTVGTVPAADRVRLAGFKEVTVTVTAADGSTRTFCLLLADTEPLREQGLMFVTDPALGGYDGMLFAYTRDTDGAFWMKNTRLPLSIAYVRADGTTAATTDMEPCPDDAPACPTYPPGATYRLAIEVPKGGLARLGIDDTSTVTVGATSCTAPDAGPPAASAPVRVTPLDHTG